MGEAERSRRRHSTEFKQQVLAACAQPVVSVAAVALAHGLNDNLVHKWRRQARVGDEAAPDGVESFLPVTLSSAASSTLISPAVIEVNVRPGAASVQIRWPATAAAECATWLRAWLARSASMRCGSRSSQLTCSSVPRVRWCGW
jgi:transposase